MTSSPENSAQIRNPRTRQVPSPRNQQIYLDYQTGQRQTDLAAQYKLTQCRISQIIRRVQKWLTAAGDTQARSASEGSRDHLQHRLQYDRLNEAARLALQHFHQPQKTFTHKTGARAGKKYDETTERLLPPNLQCLKVVVQATAQLTRLQASERPQPAGSASGAGLQNEPGDGAPDSASGHPHRGSTPQSALLPLSRENVEAWLTDHHIQAARDGKVNVDITGAPVIRDVVNALLGEPSTGLALHLLARNVGQKVVQRRPYEDQSPPVPHRDGWYYGMYDADGGLVAWLHADQLSGAITPDYPPISRAPAVVRGSPDPAPSGPTISVPGSTLGPQYPEATASSAPEQSSHPSENSSTPTNSTSPFNTNPSQPPSPSALTPASSQSQFPSPYEPHPFDLQSIEPTFYQKGCSN